jgi:hypothetical protein
MVVWSHNRTKNGGFVPDEYLMDGSAKLSAALEEGNMGKAAFIISMMAAAQYCKGEEHGAIPQEVKNALEDPRLKDLKGGAGGVIFQR